MRKRTKLSRILALVLTLSLVFQQAGITTYADDGANAAAVSVTATAEAGEDSSEAAAVQETTAETSAPATETAAETGAPTTEAAAETDAASEGSGDAETSDVGTSVDGSDAADADVTDETVAEETTEATTDAAAEAATETMTDAAAEDETGAAADAAAEEESEAESETETEAETESEVETESETEVETETESETETEEHPDTFVWEDDEKVVTVVLSDPGALPLGAEFVVEDPTEEEFEAYKALIIEQQFANNEDYGETVEERTAVAEVMLANMVLYDMYFVYEGTEIEPDANQMSVTIRNKKAVDVSPDETIVETDDHVFIQNEEAESSIVAVHIDESGRTAKVVEVTDNVKTNNNGDVKTVELTTDSFSEYAYYEVFDWLKVPYTDDTLIDTYKGSYTLYYILNNFSIFTSGDAVANHTVGAAAVGGWATFKQGIGSDKYYMNVPSYFAKGFTEGGFNDYIDSAGPGLYLTGPDPVISSDPNKIYEYQIIKFNDGSTAKGYFINFETAMAAIASEMAGYVSNNSNITVDSSVASSYYSFSADGKTVTLQAGYSYVFADLDSIDYINIVGSDGDNVNIISQEAGTVVLPKVLFDSQEKTGSETDMGCGVAFMLPNATTVDIGSKSNGTFFGHVIAPNAAVVSSVNGDTNGSFICASFNVPYMENHMWHYNGSIIKSTSHGFTALKTVDNAAPDSDDDPFTFTLSELENGAWSTVQTTTSDATGLITFNDISYSAEDTHWYLIAETAGDTTKYDFDSTLYLVKVVVTASVSGSTTTYEKAVTYYKTTSSSTTASELIDTSTNEVIISKLTELTLAANAETSTIFTFGNTSKGSLKITKSVLANEETVSSWCQTAADGEYYFEVYDSSSNKVGEATITIENGVSTTTAAEITGLAAGTYTVVEVSKTGSSAGSATFLSVTDADGTTTTTSSVTVEVTAGNWTNVPTVAFVNNLEIEGSLEISKTLAGNNPDADEEFAFTITLTGAAVSATETYKAAYTRNGSTDSEEDIVFTNGSATVYLKGGESVVISKLPAGVSYTVTEKTKAGADVTTENYEAEVSDDGGTTVYDQDCISGTISKDGTTVAFTNTKNSYGNLTIQKMVDGNGGDDDEPFTFKVTFTGDADSLKAAFGAGNVTIDTNDPSVGAYSYTFDLMHNENEVIQGIPANVTFTVEELSANTKGYETSMKVTSGTATVSNDKLTVTGTITEDCSIAVECTNTREEGDLLISKVFDTSGNDNVSTDEFTFEIALDSSFDTSLVDGDYVATYTDQDGTSHSKTVKFENGKATVTMKADESWLITGLLSGLTFTVTETTVTAKDSTTHTYTTTVQVGSATAATGTSADVTIPDATQDPTAGTWTANMESVTFTNRRDTYGELVVSKTVDSNGGNADYTEKFTFTITLDNMTLAAGETVEYDAVLTTTEDTAHGIAAASEDKKVTFAVDQTDGKVKATVELSHNQSLTISGLPNGVTYTVSEKDYSTEGWETYPPHDTSGKIEGGETKTVAYENLKETGALEITKQIAGNAADEDDNFGFTITVWTDSNKNTLVGNGPYTVKLIENGVEKSSTQVSFTNGSTTYSLKAEQTLVIEDLPAGAYYEVIETDTNSYDSTTYTINGGTSQTGITAAGTIPTSGGTGADTNADVVFTNTKNTYGDLLIRKTVESNAETEAAGDSDYEKKFTFTVTLDNVTLADGETVTYDAVLTTTEDTTHGITAATKDTSVTFEKDGTTGKTTATITLSHNQSMLIKNLPNGTTYTVQEQYDTVSADFETTVATGISGTLSEDKNEKVSASGTIIGGAEEYVAYTNAREVGSLEIKKTVDGNDYSLDDAFEFTIVLVGSTATATYPAVKTDANGKSTETSVTFTSGKATGIMLKGDETITIKNLPAGTSYHVYEVGDPDDGYQETAVTGNRDTIVSGETKTASFTNTKNTYGSLTVKKIVDGNAGNTSQEFNFTVTLTNGSSITGQYGGMYFDKGVATFTLKNGQSATAIGLPTGTTYTVTEESYTSEGYVTTVQGTEVVTVVNAVTGTSEQKTQNTDTDGAGTIYADCDLTEIFTNTKNVGSLTISKVLAGNDPDTDDVFTFTITLTDAQGNAVTGTYSGVSFGTDGTATITLKGGESKTFNNLPDGTVWTATEKDASSDGYAAAVETSGTVVSDAALSSTEAAGATGTIDKDKASTAVFTNTKDTYGDLTITKTVAGNAGGLLTTFEFTVTLSDETINTAYNALHYSANAVTGTDTTVTFTNGVSEKIALKDGESLTIRNLPTGVTYTVTEKDYSSYGYVTTVQGTEVVIDAATSAKETVNTDEDGSGIIYADCDLTENFTNTRNVGSVKVIKALAGNGTDENQEFTFDVSLVDSNRQPLSGTYDATRYDSDGKELETLEVEFDAEGKATLTLKGGESILIEGILSGAVFAAEENSSSAAGYTVYPYWNVTETVPVGHSAVFTFRNTRNTYADLAITKSVEGTGADETKAFKFTVTLDDSDMLNDTTFEDTYDAVLYTSADDTTGTAATVTFTKTTDAATGAVTGTATTMTVNGETEDIALSHGQSLVIKDLPNGVKYTVTEADYSESGYTVTSAGAAGTIEGVDTTVTPQTGGTSTAAFVNTYKAAGSLTLKATKSMAREDSTLGTFEFVLTEVSVKENGAAEAAETGKVLQTVKNNTATGAIAFETLEYTQEDIGKTFTYTVSEKSQTGTGYLFDDTVYTVTVEVGNNGDGTLKLTTTVKDASGTETAYTDTVMTFTNDVTSVKIKKVDVTTQEELPGATIQILILDENGDVKEIVDEWTSTTEAHEVTGLIPGETYTLRETVAPEGYDTTADTTFVLNEDGTIDTENTTTTVSGGVLLVEDQMTISETAEISVTKNLQLDTGDTLMAKDQTFYVGLYTDAACTMLYASKPIEFKNASASTVTFTGLEIGRTYYIAECDADGEALVSGYALLADGTKYMPDFGDDTMTATVTAENGSEKTVTFTNVFYSVPDGFYREGTLTITKKLLGADGRALTSDAVFYAGIFTDASCTTLATNVDQNIVTLALAGRSEVSAEVSVSIEAGETVTLYVTEVVLDENGNPVPAADAEGFQYTVSMDTTEVTLSETNRTADVTITNQEIEETEESESEEESEEEESETEAKAVQTGDETPILPYMLAMLAALIVLLAGILERKRRNAR